MSGFPEALAEHLDREVTTVCHGWRLTRTDGVVRGFTDHDRPVAVAGVVYAPETGLSATEARSSLGLAVDTVDVEGALSSDAISDEDISRGLLDGATVETVLVNWRDPEQFALLRTARVGKISRSDGRFVAELESLTRALDRPNGRTITRGCDAELGDARCGFSLGAPGFAGGGAVTTVLGTDAFHASGLGAFAAGWLDHGTITWTSGPRLGATDRILRHRVDAGGVRLTLDRDTEPAPAPGDAFTATAGCDKSFATCKAKFGNAVNFRGFPHLPGNDAAYAYVTSEGAFDGGPLVP